MRLDGRGLPDLRPLKVEMGYLEWAEGSALLEVGKTRVLAAASYEPKVPRFLMGSGSGWVTAEGGQQIAIGYFEPSDHIYHVELARAFTLADHYFCARRAQCSKEPWTTPRFYSSSSTPFPRRLIRSRCQPSTPGAEGSPIPEIGRAHV